MRKKILWISRHPLWSVQIHLLKKMYGKKIEIEQRNIRFEDIFHFLDFLDQEYNNYKKIFSVVPERWKNIAKENDFLIGTIHRPKLIRNQGKKKRIFRISFVGKEGILSKVYGNKGYHKPKRRKKK